MQSLYKPSQPANIPGLFELDFCTIRLLSDDTAEIIIYEGVDVSRAMVEQTLGVLRSTLSAPFCLLVNELNAHSYDFQAQTALGATNDLHAVAMVSYNPLMDMAARCLMRLPRPTSWPMAVFPNKKDALAWLRAMQPDGAKIAT